MAADHDADAVKRVRARVTDVLSFGERSRVFARLFLRAGRQATAYHARTGVCDRFARLYRVRRVNAGHSL